jgi:hypothetical protein
MRLVSPGRIRFGILLGFPSMLRSEFRRSESQWFSVVRRHERVLVHRSNIVKISIKLRLPFVDGVLGRVHERYEIQFLAVDGCGSTDRPTAIALRLE